MGRPVDRRLGRDVLTSSAAVLQDVRRRIIEVAGQLRDQHAGATVPSAVVAVSALERTNLDELDRAVEEALAPILAAERAAEGGDDEFAWVP